MRAGVIIIGRSSSSCSSCGGSANFSHKTHSRRSKYGYSQLPGCGAKYTACSTDDMGLGRQSDYIISLAGGLPFIPYRDLFEDEA